MDPSKHALFMVLMFNATFNNISVILWQSFLLVEETGVAGENYQPVTSPSDKKKGGGDTHGMYKSIFC
jgi:hypothetical protein